MKWIQYYLKINHRNKMQWNGDTWIAWWLFCNTFMNEMLTGPDLYDFTECLKIIIQKLFQGSPSQYFSLIWYNGRWINHEFQWFYKRIMIENYSILSHYQFLWQIVVISKTMLHVPSDPVSGFDDDLLFTTLFARNVTIWYTQISVSFDNQPSDFPTNYCS